MAIILLLAFIFLQFSVQVQPIEFKVELDASSDSITYEEGVAYLSHCQTVHTLYAEHPEYCNDYTGSPEFHQIWADRYGKIIDLLERKR